MILSVTSLKGGVGKSTIAQNLAVCFAHAGYKICIVDVDTNQSALRWSGLRDESLPAVPVVALNDDVGLAKNVKHLNEDHEIVIIDGTPSLSQVTSKIILLADLLIIPIQPSGLDVWATEKFLERYNNAVEQKEATIPAQFLINQNQSTNLSKEVHEILEQTDIPVFKSSIRSRIAYREAVIKGLGVFEYKDEKAKQEMADLFKEIQSIIRKLNKKK
ncbi:MAG: chromosome partitioning protein [Dyadobacter sp. 50-39]|uniref:ParA family partition ATPase n=1 Tax=Dyadobacter sp. 50-39 TaxID=1895756 RepID=UPI000960569C|nr:ParA family partition ATPase [Dyadobacter sp. 50-39]OJV19300.1 MAG: chromosome partitioning protein [Dyadobacter sp. 50-39]